MPRTRNGKPDGEPPKRAPRAASGKPPKRAAVGKSAKDPAEGERKPQQRFTMIERLRIAERVAAARAKPKPDTWAVIARRENVQERTLRRIYDDYVESNRKLGDSSGSAILAESLMLYTYAIDRAAYEAEYGETSAARTGALRTMLDAMKGRIELLAVMGRMPRSFRAMDELAALQRLVRKIAEIVEKHQFPPEVVIEFLAMADEVQPIIEGTTVALPKAS